MTTDPDLRTFLGGKSIFGFFLGGSAFFISWLAGLASLALFFARRRALGVNTTRHRQSPAQNPPVGGIRSLDVSEKRDGQEGRVRSQERQGQFALGCRSWQSIRLRERGIGAQGTVGARGACVAPPLPLLGPGPLPGGSTASAAAGHCGVSCCLD